MLTTEEYKKLGVASPCPQCLAATAKIRANDPDADAEFEFDEDVGELLIKHGRYGEFIACSLRCGYTRSIPGRSATLATKAELRAVELRKKCPTCRGTGYVPFKKPDGTLSRYAQSPCPACGGYDHERSYADANMLDRQPEDFDFPCSETWRVFYNGERNQPALVASPAPDTMNDRRWDSVQQMRAEVKYLRQKVTEMRIERKKREGEY